MQCEVFRLLEPAEVDRIAGELANRTFTDGKLTAHGYAREVKHNLQIDRTGLDHTEMDGIFVAAMARNKAYQSFAMPNRFMMPIFSRYEPGMAYGDHVDNSLMGGYSGMRTDLAMTLFLSPPETYEGGELAIQLSGGEQQVKLDSGEAVVYPATSVHHVNPVTRGVRLAAVTWIQSAIRDERVRAILYDLSQAMKHVPTGSEHTLGLLLNKSYHNLVRYAAEP